MATVAISATETAVADGTTYVSSAQTYAAKIFMASDMDADEVVRVEATSTGTIECCDSTGHRIGIVPAESSALLSRTDTGEWRFFLLPASPAALVADGSDAATTQTLANALKAILQAAGLMKAE